MVAALPPDSRLKSLRTNLTQKRTSAHPACPMCLESLYFFQSDNTDQKRDKRTMDTLDTAVRGQVLNPQSGSEFVGPLDGTQADAFVIVPHRRVRTFCCTR